MKENHKSQSSLFSIRKLTRPYLELSNPSIYSLEKEKKKIKTKFYQHPNIISKKSKFVRDSFTTIERKLNIQDKYHRNGIEMGSLEQSIQENRTAFNHKMSVKMAMLERQREGKLSKFFHQHSKSKNFEHQENPHNQYAKTFYKALPFWKKNKLKIGSLSKQHFSKTQIK